MTKPKLTCRDCGKQFLEQPNKRGFRNQCPTCSLEQEEPELLGGNLIYSHKTAPELELKSLSKAREFARASRRFGAGVLKVITESKEKSFRDDYKE